MNYKSAVKRFKDRLEFSGNKKLRRVVKTISITYLIVVALYFAAYAMSINDLLCYVVIPMSSEVISVLILIVILLLLPPVIPYIKSITINGLGLDLTQD